MKNQWNYSNYDDCYELRFIGSIMLQAFAFIGLIPALLNLLNEKSNVLLSIVLITQFNSALSCLVTDVAVHKNTWIDDFTAVYVMFVFGVTIEYYSILPAIWFIILAEGDALLIGGSIVVIISTFFRHVINAVTIIKMNKIVNKADIYDLYNDGLTDIRDFNN